MPAHPVPLPVSAHNLQTEHAQSILAVFPALTKLSVLSLSFEGYNCFLQPKNEVTLGPEKLSRQNSDIRISE